MPTADELISSQTARDLRAALQAAAPKLPFADLSLASSQLAGLGLRQRVDLLSAAILSDLPGDYAELAAVIRQASDGTPALGGWMIWPVTVAVAERATAEATGQAFDDGMALLAALTPKLSAEFALRVLLRADLHRGLRIVGGWTAADDPHLRRLASEGTRPYLPWAIRVPGLIGSADTTPVLDALYQDESDYVRRSVANHLNDLSRDQPRLTVEIARRWLAHPAPTTPAVVRHGLRTLVKQGDPAALALLGYNPEGFVVTGPVVHTLEVAYPGSLRFSAVVHNNGADLARVAVDYVIHHQRANGSTTPKTFKLTTRTLAPGERLSVERSHPFRPITTRRYYPGPHTIALQVNGRATEPVTFILGESAQMFSP